MYPGILSSALPASEICSDAPSKQAVSPPEIEAVVPLTQCDLRAFLPVSAYVSVVEYDQSRKEVSWLRAGMDAVQMFSLFICECGQSVGGAVLAGMC